MLPISIEMKRGKTGEVLFKSEVMSLKCFQIESLIKSNRFLVGASAKFAVDNSALVLCATATRTGNFPKCLVGIFPL